jgi:hypothetical protein
MNRIWNVVEDMINTEYQNQRASESQMGKYPKKIHNYEILFKKKLIKH